MSMTPSKAAKEIVAALKEANPDIKGEVETKMVETWTKICKGIIEEVRNMTITATAPSGGGPVTFTGVQ